MYYSQEVSERIRKMAHKKGVTIKEILDACGLNINTISKKSESGMASFSLAKIADYLDCSVDYLLCRTENPDSHNAYPSNAVLNSQYNEQIMTLCKIYAQLDVVAKANLITYADELRNRNRND